MRTRLFVTLAFFMSGAAGLIFEVVWLHRCGLVFANTRRNRRRKPDGIALARIRCERGASSAVDCARCRRGDRADLRRVRADPGTRTASTAPDRRDPRVMVVRAIGQIFDR